MPKKTGRGSVSPRRENSSDSAQPPVDLRRVPRLAIYVDPGDRYHGVAVFELSGKAVQGEPPVFHCVDAFTLDCESGEEFVRERFYGWLKSMLMKGELDVLGFEVYRLYGDKAQEQKGSEFVASQTIGVLKFLAWEHAESDYRVRMNRPPVEVVRFLPDHKKATAGILESRGYRFESRRRKAYGDHAWDAELQGCYDLIKNRGWVVESRPLGGTDAEVAAPSEVAGRPRS